MTAFASAVSSAAFDHLLVGIGATPARHLDHLVSLSYKALLAGQLDDVQIETLHRASQARRDVFAARARVQQHPVPRPLPLSPPRADTVAMRKKRRTWGASGALPQSLRCMFTLGENAVAAVVRAEVRKHGVCSLSHAAIAKSAGLSGVTVVKRFMRIAETERLIEIQRRPVRGAKHKTIVVSIVSLEWIAWNALGEETGGTAVSSYQNRRSKYLSLPPRRPATRPAARPQGAWERGSPPARAAPG